eukprot:COSAG01_NODE_48241_length_383_cov_0.535211_1_plen_20_part_10
MGLTDPGTLRVAPMSRLTAS